MSAFPSYRQLRDKLLTQAFNGVLRAMAVAADLRRRGTRWVAETWSRRA